MDRFESWHKFATQFSENLFFDDILLDRWSQRIFKSEGGGARLKKMIDLFSTISYIREQIADIPSPGSKKPEGEEMDEEHLLNVLTMELEKHSERIINFFGGDVNPSIQNLILSLALRESLSVGPLDNARVLNQRSLTEKIREFLIQMHMHDANEGPGWSAKSLIASVEEFCDSNSYPEEAKTKILASTSTARIVSVLLDYATDFEAGEVSSKKKAADVENAVIALQPDGYEDQSAEEWANYMATSLGVSPEYITKILEANKKTPARMPVSKAEMGLSKGAAFDLNYLSLYNSPLVGEDQYWYIKQYTALKNAEKETK